MTTRPIATCAAGRAPAWDDERYYALMRWGIERPDGQADYYAPGDHGQYVFVSPENQVIIVRMGVEYGVSFRPWIDGFARASDGL
jgi:CubicO group peptidase (beta-lactamase class C family)